MEYQEELMMKKEFLKNLQLNNKKVLIGLVLVVIFFTIILINTYANKADLALQNMISKVIYIDTEAYGENVFDSSNLVFCPILDEDIDKDNNHVIYISFYVGGASTNNTDDIVYDIALSDLEVDCELLSPYVKWKLLKNNEVISEGSLDYQFDTISDGRLILTPIQQDLVDYNEDKSKYDYYEFYMWLSDSCQNIELIDCVDDEEQNGLLNKRIIGRVEVELYKDIKKELVRNPSQTLNTETCVMENNNE